MARPLRIEFAGALYRITSRGDRREAIYEDDVDISTCEISEGTLPKKQTKLVLAWAELHQDELMADWELVMNGEDPFRIQPLQ